MPWIIPLGLVYFPTAFMWVSHEPSISSTQPRSVGPSCGKNCSWLWIWRVQTPGRDCPEISEDPKGWHPIDALIGIGSKMNINHISTIYQQYINHISTWSNTNLIQAILWLRQEVIDFEKSKTVLYGQWGFGGRTAFSGGQPETCHALQVAQDDSRIQ